MTSKTCLEIWWWIQIILFRIIHCSYLKQHRIKNISLWEVQVVINFKFLNRGKTQFTHLESRIKLFHISCIGMNNRWWRSLPILILDLRAKALCKTISKKSNFPTTSKSSKVTKTNTKLNLLLQAWTSLELWKYHRINKVKIKYLYLLKIHNWRKAFWKMIVTLSSLRIIRQ